MVYPNEVNSKLRRAICGRCDTEAVPQVNKRHEMRMRVNIKQTLKRNTILSTLDIFEKSSLLTVLG